uniref:UTP6 small subunit processome component n=1 Tax=Astyanax mexicanus TaxID=7994 RepID=A0A8B9LN59_ASTMX
MADYVQQRLEDRIPALEQLERVGLFTKKEVKSMLKKSTAMEYKLHRTVLSKEDFISYIQYEINVLELIKKRRARIGYHFKREEIEHSIIHGIISVFRRATSKWQEDVQLWLSHIAFSKKWGTKGQLSKVFASVLAIHPDKPSLWIMAAKCQMEDCGSSESARHLFLRALRFHPENKKVYQEYFRMELMHAEKLRKQQEELERAKMDFSPEILSGKLAEVVYRNATQKIKGAEFMLSLLQIAAIFDFTKELQETILQDLQTEHTDDSVTWDFMARRELDAAGAPELQDARGRASDANRREERCCAVYEEGVKNLNTGNARINMIITVVTAITVCLSLQLQVLLSSGETESAAQVAIEATKRFSQSVETWHLSLQTLVSLERVEAGLLFQEALNHVNPKVSAEEQLLLNGTSTHNTSTTAKALLSPVPAISTALKETYLEWAFKTGGYKKARKTFKSLHEHRPFTKTFFTKMVQIEKEQENPKISNLRDYYERALREFGSSDDDLWMDYIREELGAHGSPENCGKLHWRAMKSLEGECVERFTTQYTLLQTGHI